MKYKVGDKVRIKSLDWYEANKDNDGDISLIDSQYNFIREMANFCGMVVTVVNTCGASGYYDIEEDGGRYYWTDEMIECLVEPASDNQDSKMVSLDKVEEFLESCMFNVFTIEEGKEVPYEIMVNEYRSVSELINALRKAMEE